MKHESASIPWFACLEYSVAIVFTNFILSVVAFVVYIFISNKRNWKSALITLFNPLMPGGNKKVTHT